jgi:hypothetical protein
MNPYLARATGYDFANLWMNLAKVLVIFLFVYQQTLETQLGISLFQGGFYIFDSNDADNQENGPLQVVTHDDPLFSINFLPISTTTSYDHVRLKVYQVTGQEGPLPLNEEKAFSSAFPSVTGEKGNPVRKAEFNIREIIQPQAELATGLYTIGYSYQFLSAPGEVLHEEWGAGGTQYQLSVKYSIPAALRFGDFPVVQGQWFDVPAAVKGADITWTNWTSRSLTKDQWSEPTQGVVVSQRADSLYPASKLLPGRIYRQRGYYLKRNSMVEVEITFNLLKNRPPQSTYVGSEDADFIRLYSDRRWDNPDPYFQYFNLSELIIDPDGKDKQTGKPRVHVRSMSLRRPDNDFEVIRSPENRRDFWLKVNGNVEEVLRNEGGQREIQVVTKDDFSSQVITVELVLTRLRVN